MPEEWRKVLGFDHDYQVSDQGRFRKDGKILSPSDINGYLCVNLNRGGRSTVRMLHRLILSAFIRNPVNGEIGLHCNDDRRDNTLGNLRWGSHADNMADAAKNGRLEKLADETVRMIRGSRKTDLELASELGRSEMTVFRIRTGQTYRHVT